MCVLGRPFGIRQMVEVGGKVALMRDMTDTMDNPQMPPGVDHFPQSLFMASPMDSPIR